MRYTTTDGKVYDIPNRYSCCQMTTGEQHQLHCPYSQSLAPAPRVAKPFAQLFLRCPWCAEDMQLDGYKLEKGLRR